MKITGAYTIPVDQQRAYQLLQDPDVLAKCMPGCDKMVKVADDEYDMKMKMLIAAISGQFDGKVRIADQSPPNSFRLIVEGTGKVGFMKGDGLLQLSPNGEDTSVHFEGDVQVGGTIASVGQRLLDMTSKMLIKRFFDNLRLVAQGAAT
jgi:uncharacterized protein